MGGQAARHRLILCKGHNPLSCVAVDVSRSNLAELAVCLPTKLSESVCLSVCLIIHRLSITAPRAAWVWHVGLDDHVGLDHRGVVDIRGRRDFSRFDPSPGEASV